MHGHGDGAGLRETMACWLQGDGQGMASTLLQERASWQGTAGGRPWNQGRERQGERDGGGDHQGTFGHQGEAAGAHGAMGRDVGVRREKGRVSACLGDGYEKPPDRGHVLEQGVSVCDKNKRRDNVYR